MNEMDGEERYWLWLASVDGLFSKWFYQLISVFMEPREVWDNAEAILRRMPKFPPELARNIIGSKKCRIF
ncbi:MAG: hypothetical protein WCP73_02230 [Eubacteriales bacterium]